MNIKKAYKVGKEMERSSKGLHVAKELVNFNSRSKIVLAKFKVGGGKEDHTCLISWLTEEMNKAGGGKRIKLVKTENAFARVLPLKSSEECQVHCDCSDYQFTFYPAIAKDDSNLAEFPVYKPKGTGVARAIKEIGLCKHLMLAVEELREGGWIK